MPRQPTIRFTKPVSRMLKADLQRLCQHFHIPVDGAVVTLRNRLNNYLRLHANDLRNDRHYAALYPQHRGHIRRQATPVNLNAQPEPGSPHSVTLGSESDNNDYPAWNGVVINHEPNLVIPHDPSPTPEPEHANIDDGEVDNDADAVEPNSVFMDNSFSSPEPDPQPRTHATHSRHNSLENLIGKLLFLDILTNLRHIHLHDEPASCFIFTLWPFCPLHYDESAS